MSDFKCPFCEEQINNKMQDINKNRIIAETEDFIVFPTTGGFVDNYQLVIPKKHINCIGELSLEQLNELKNIIIWQKEINKKYFNSDSCMFEHGSLNPSNENGKSIVHAHLHIFPNNISLLKNIEEYNFNALPIEDIEKLRSICKNFKHYLYYSDIDGSDYVITHEGIPSQFLRMILAKSIGKNNWNWREYPLFDNIEKNIQFYQTNKLIYK